MKKKSTFIINFLAIVVLFVIAVVGWNGIGSGGRVRAGQLASWPALTLHKILISTALAIAPEDELQQQIDETQKLLDMSVNATKPLESEVQRISQRISSAQATVNQLRQEQEARQAEIKAKEAEMSEQYQIFSARVDQQYRQGRLFSPIVTLVSSWQAGQGQKAWRYSMTLAERDKKIIEDIGINVIELQQAKTAAAEQEKRLISLQNQLNDQKAFFEKEIEGAKAYQATLQTKIAELSARQQEILAEKSGTFSTTVGDVPLADDPASRPDYDPGFSPAFAAFSFGAPHFKGMSQYGAFGRAKSGQDYKQILKAYYGDGIEIKDHDPNATINVEGYGSYSLEEYAKRIYEMPASWGDDGGMEALKAQAVAARSYALARGGNICATESCQVFKPEPKGGNWEKAVNETKGKVVYANDKPFSTLYASTSGGYQESYKFNDYSTPGFWDTKNGRSGWTSSAYEKIAESPWFYKGWYKSRSGDSCGRSHPWLTAEEMADVLNAWVVIVKSGNSDDRVTPIGDCWGGNPYSIGELRDRAESVGTGYHKVTNASVTYATNGITAEVKFQTDKGEVKIKGSEFYKAFNLRAPGRIALKSGLFNIELK